MIRVTGGNPESSVVSPGLDSVSKTTCSHKTSDLTLVSRVFQTPWTLSDTVVDWQVFIIDLGNEYALANFIS